MQNSFVKAALFTVGLCAIYIYIGEMITEISGGAKTAATAAGVSPEAGEVIFWGKGKCHTCHSLGGKGSAIRGPNLGVSGAKFPLPIALRAEERAKELSAKTGKPMTAADYLVQTHHDPGAYVVEGYKDEMPAAWKAPIKLKPEEILAVDLYLQSLGGEPNVGALSGSPFFALIKKAAESQKGKPAEEFKLYLKGDPEKGKALFFDPESKAPCAKCHIVGDTGGKVGPELTSVAGTRDLSYIVQSVLEPSAEIASGYEPYLVVTKDGEFITGVKKAEDDKSVTMADTEGEERKVSKSNIEKMVQQKKSIMPDNLRELLTIDEFHDLLAYLDTLK